MEGTVAKPKLPREAFSRCEWKYPVGSGVVGATGTTSNYGPVTLRIGEQGPSVESSLGLADGQLDWGKIERSAVEAFHSEDRLFSAEGYVNRSEIEAQARYLIEHRTEVSEQYKTKATYRDDARTLLFEALTASGHLSKVEISGTLQEIHGKMLTILLNSYDDSLPRHERSRRFQEICEELTLQKVEIMIQNGDLPSDTEVATISDYISPGAMSSETAMSIGYRESNKKGMARSSKLRRLQDGTYCRVTEQCSRSHADAKETRGFLNQQGINSPVSSTIGPETPDDVVVLGTQILHRMNGGVVDLMMMLDQYQSNSRQKQTMYGENPSDTHIPYADLRRKSRERETAAKCYIDDLATFTRQLDDAKNAGRITSEQYKNELSNKVLTILRAICVVDPQYAESCFGENAKAGFEKASEQAASGDTVGAARTIEGNTENESTVTVCGSSMSKEEAKAKGIEATSLAEQIKNGLENYKTKKGFCRVQYCPSKPKITDVGPCNVCMDNCQVKYDKGWSGQRIKAFYMKLKRVQNKLTEKVIPENLKSKKSKVSSWVTNLLFNKIT